MDDKGGLERSLQDRDGVGVTLAHPTGSSWDTAGVFSLDNTPQRYQVIRSIGASSQRFAVEAGFHCIQSQSLREKRKVHLCGFGIPLSTGDACSLPSQWLLPSAHF